ncbi:MAG: hypothetical protein QXS30_02470 [Thermoplasmatales archaeon]
MDDISRNLSTFQRYVLSDMLIRVSDLEDRASMIEDDITMGEH